MMYKSLTEAILGARICRKMTQEKAALMIGCSLRTYKGWESGRKPLAVWLSDIRKFTKVSSQALMNLWQAL